MKFSVIFETQSRAKPPGGNSIILTLNENSFDEFSSMMCDLRIIKNSEPIAYLSESVRLFWITGTSFFENNAVKKFLSAKQPKYYVQLVNEKFYRILLKAMGGPKETLAVLQKLHDLGTLRKIGKSVSKSIFETHVYSHILNNSSFRYSYERGSSVLNKFWLARAKRRDSFVNREIKFNIGFKNDSYAIELDYQKRDILPSYYYAFVGANGSGKSYTLNAIISQLLVGTSNENEKPNLSTNSIVVFSNTPHDTYPKSLKQFKNAWSKSGYTYVNLATGAKFVADNQVKSKFNTSTEILDILMSERTEAAIIDKLKVMTKTLRKVCDFDEIKIPLDLDVSVSLSDIRKNELALSEISTREDVYFERKGVPIYLSSGQRVFVNFIISFIARMEHNSIIIVDEPENFLHPNFEIEFVSIFCELLKQFNSIGIIATHSSVILRETPSRFVKLFINTGDNINVFQPKIETFGCDLQTISNYVFNDLGTRRGYLQYLSEISKGSKTVADLAQKMSGIYDDSLITQAITYIRK